MITIQTALLSVSDKTGLIEFADFLAKRDVKILSTGGTLKALRDAGIHATAVEDYTGFPEMMDGRLKTLHPKVHGGLLGIRSEAEHKRAMEDHGILGIDLLVVNLYPFARTMFSGKSFEDCIENIDIGGPAMLRAAAKNYHFVTALTSPDEYSEIRNLVEAKGGIPVEESLRFAKKVFEHTSAYDAMIASYLQGKAGEEFPVSLNLSFRKVQDLRYGENPHQKAAFYRSAVDLEREIAQSIPATKQIQGKELSFNNLLDISAALQAAYTYEKTAAVIVKHLNPCGVGVAASTGEVSEAFERARKCDPVSAFGGVMAFNVTVDAKTAHLIGENFTECIIAPSFSKESLEFFATKRNLRLLEIHDPKRFMYPRKEIRPVHDGILVEDADLIGLDKANWKIVTKRNPTEEEMEGLDFAWRLVRHVKSNAIVFANFEMSLGIGAGQMSRVDAAEIAITKAAKNQMNLSGSVVASDAFFPFRDGLDLCAKAGAKAIIQPGGSVRDAEVIAAADEQGIVMVFTGVRHFRH